MSFPNQRLSNQQLVQVFSLLKNATAIYTSDDIVVEMATDSMISFWKKDRSVIGKPLIEGVPELAGQPFIGILRNVWRTGITYEAKEIAAAFIANGRLETFYFDFEYRAVLNDDGTTYCILHTATDATERIKNRELTEITYEQQEALMREQTLNEELRSTNEELHSAQESLFHLNAELEDRVRDRVKDLVHSEERFRNMVNLAPVSMLITRGKNMIIEICNKPLITMVGKDETIIGKPLFDAVPELTGQPIEMKLRNTFLTGKTWRGIEEPVTILKEGVAVSGYFNVTYEPIMEGGDIVGLLQSAVEVTDQVRARLSVQALNEQLAAANEELKASNEELQRMQAILYERNNQMRASEESMRLAAEASGLGTFAINAQTLELVASARLKELMGFEAGDEMTYELSLQQIRPEFKTGVTEKVQAALTQGVGFELEYQVAGFRNGKLRWLRSVGAMQYNHSTNERILTGVVIDITPQVQSTQAIRENEERLRLIIESANLGTWYINAETREFIPSSRLKELFGYQPHETMTYADAVSHIADDYRESVVAAVETAITQHQQYDLEYPVMSHSDGKMRWVRATGKLFPSQDGKAGTFSGTIADITERKHDEQRKNDFIGMVSHEMKTPLTSMSLYLQMLEAYCTESVGSTHVVMLEKARKQVTKMTNLINGFLNVSRLEAGKIEISKKLFNMAQLIKEAEEETLTTIKTHRIIFAPVESIMVVADHDKISQVVNNLISNAVKYSPANSTINVACIQENSSVVVSVKDEGIGIMQEDIDKLFGRYYRVANQTTKSISGFGIGLYLCSEILQRHDGKIWAESEVNKGSTFYFSLTTHTE